MPRSPDGPPPRDLSYSPRSPDVPPPRGPMTPQEAYNPYAGEKFTFGDDEVAKYKQDQPEPPTTQQQFYIGSRVIYKGNEWSVRMVEGDNLYIMDDIGGDEKVSKADVQLIEPSDVSNGPKSNSSMDYGPNGNIRYDSDGSIDYGPPRASDDSFDYGPKPETEAAPEEEPEGDSAPDVSDEDEGF